MKYIRLRPGTQKVLFGVALAMCTLGITFSTAQASAGTKPGVQRFYADSGVSLDEAVSRVRRQTNGKILSAETVRANGRMVHVIKVLTPDGRVKRVRIDARGRGG